MNSPKLSRNDLIRVINQLQNENLTLQQTVSDMLRAQLEMREAVEAIGYEFTYAHTTEFTYVHTTET